MKRTYSTLVFAAVWTVSLAMVILLIWAGFLFPRISFDAPALIVLFVWGRLTYEAVLTVGAHLRQLRSSRQFSRPTRSAPALATALLPPQPRVTTR